MLWNLLFLNWKTSGSAASHTLQLVIRDAIKEMDFYPRLSKTYTNLPKFPNFHWSGRTLFLNIIRSFSSRFQNCIYIFRLDSSSEEINCIIKYKYKYLSATEVTTAPGFYLNKSGQHDIRRGYCEYSFSAKESVLRKPLEKHPLALRIYNNDQWIGTANVDLSLLFTNSATRTLDSRIANVQAEISSHDSEKSQVVGNIECQFTLKELGKALLPLMSTKSAFEPVIKKPTIGGAAAGPEKENDSSMHSQMVALQIEEWKHNQNKTFKNQLQNIGQASHY